MNYPAIRIEGGILSPDLFDRLDDIPGQRPADFGLDANARVKDEIARAWADAQDYWRIFQRKLAGLRPNAPATTETRQQWVVPLLSLLGYQLEYQREGTLVGEKNYPLSHRVTNRANTVAQIIGYGDPAGLDRKPERTAGPRISAHGLVQEYLNLSDQLYGLATNGKVLRLLRDSSRLVKLTFLEFDLERIFTEGLFADFALLYRLLHATRLPTSQEAAHESLIERYHQDSLESGVRIREGLSRAVEEAIRAFANGLLRHPQNEPLRAAVAGGRLRPGPFYEHLLHLIYRLLFLFVIEERQLVYPLSPSKNTKDLYYRYYSLQRLRRLAEKRHLADPRKEDLWLALLACFRLFESDGPGAKLGLAPLAGDLFGPEAIGSMGECLLDNATVLGCLRSLSLYESPQSRQLIRVNYAALNVEELGSIYEGLLKFEPGFEPEGPALTFTLRPSGDDTQSHYTPDDLVKPLLQNALDHLIAEKLAAPGREEQERGLLSLRVADISCGSGHILLAAARRIATELARVRTGEEQPSPQCFREAVRDVICQCIYGVDLNPLAVELCKVALWMEAHSAGKPLNFLDHHIKCGNAIVGFARRGELERGVPDEAFTLLPGDEKKVAAALRKRNKAERRDKAQRKLDLAPEMKEQLAAHLASVRKISALPEQTPAEIEAKKKRYLAAIQSAETQRLSLLACLPIAQFYHPKTAETRPHIVTDEAFRAVLEGKPPQPEEAEAAEAAMEIARRKQFFHWFLEFPEIIDRGGFDCILGNPPYLGGTHLSGSYGHSFCHYVKWEYAPAGLSDLVAYFVRRIFSLLRPGGFTGFITTNSIKDGDIRKDGLEQVMAQGGSIHFAVRGIKWPGHANLVVSLVAVHKGKWMGRCLLDYHEADHITAYFDDATGDTPPHLLAQNAEHLFAGFDILGDGFFISHEEAANLIQHEAVNGDVIFPAINGQELNNHPKQSPGRSVINFLDLPIDKACKYSEPFKIVKTRVKPFRDTQNRKRNRDIWWLYNENRAGLRRELIDIQHCFCAAATTKYLNFSALPTHYIFTHALKVLATDRWDLYAVVQSTLHEVWARKYSGALETRLRYSPSDCFETFPFPEGQWRWPDAALADIGERYHEHRRATMLRLWLGLTDLYNLFHASDLSPALVAKVSGKPAAEAEAGFHAILRLRELHQELDQTLLAAYGWPDIPLGYGFHELETLPENDRTRHTIHPAARKEILARLLALNHACHAEQVASVKKQAPLRLMKPAKKRKLKPALPPRKHSKGINFKRAAIAAYILDSLDDRSQFGRTQMMKGLYLAQQDVGIDLELEFQRLAAGPFDEEIYNIESLAGKQQWFVTTPREGCGGASYRRGVNIADRCNAAISILGKAKPRFDQILDFIKKMDTDRVELWVTVHAVWNDQLREKKPVCDEVIVQGVYGWHPSKTKFEKGRILCCIQWMGENRFAPTGIHFETRVASLQNEFDLFENTALSSRKK